MTHARPRTSEFARTHGSYSYERLCFDRWAAWCEGRWDQALGLPKETLLSKIARFGVRVGISHAGNEPEIRDEPEVVSLLMEEWSVSSRLCHAALMARHRRILNGLRLSQVLDEQGQPRRFRDRDFAFILLGDGSDSGKRRFQRLCETGYIELRERLRGRSAPPPPTPPT